MPLKTMSGNASRIDVAIYPSGVAVVAWEQAANLPDGGTEHSIYARFYARPIR